MNSSSHITERLVTPSGVTVEYDLWGEIKKDAILLLHGGGQTRHSWNATAEKITHSGGCAITMDLRGHGNSDWSNKGEVKKSVVSVKQVLKQASNLGIDVTDLMVLA